MAETAGETRPVATEDLYAFELVGDPQCSPDGRRVAYVLTTIDREADDYRSAIYVTATEGGGSRRFTAGAKRDHSPRWSPNGRWLAFVSDRAGKPQVHVIGATGGEAWAVTNLPDGVGSEPVWAPDSRRIAFVARLAPPDPAEWAGKSDEERRKLREARPREITALRYKMDGEGFRDGRVRHIFVVDREADPARDAPRQLTNGDCDSIQPAWSPDGRLLAFISNRTPDREFNDTADVYVLPAEGGEPRKLTPSRGPAANPAFSPDGRQIAYFGHDNPPDTGPATNDTVWVLALPDNPFAETAGEPVEPRDLTRALDMNVGSGVGSDMRGGAGPHAPTWTPDGRALLFLAAERGNAPLYRVEAATGATARLIGGDRQILSFSLAANGERLVFAAADPLDPGQVYVAGADGSGARRLTDANRSLLAGLRLARPERLTYPSTDGETIEGWLLKPHDFAERAARGERIPLILEIHGGPHAMYGNSFFLEFQLLAARGWAVLYTNPRGSIGYGQAFTSALRGDWGGVDQRDVMAGVDHVLDQDWADPGRLGVTGGSYGGYLTNWLIGRTDRFRAAVTGRSTCNRYSHALNSDIGFRTGQWEFGGLPWENTAHYLERSPISHVADVRTPVLIQAQEQDHRCPIEQSEELFTALRLLGREVEFVRYPNESHGMSRNGKPSNRVYRLNRLLGWLERHLG